MQPCYLATLRRCLADQAGGDGLGDGGQYPDYGQARGAGKPGIAGGVTRAH